MKAKRYICRVSHWLVLALPLVLFIAAWYGFTFGNGSRAFFFGSPERYLVELWNGIFHGTLISDTWTTGIEAGVGFAVGNIVGVLLGLLLWRLRRLSRILRPYIIVLGSAPLFAFAPIIIIWFGIGFAAKVAVAILSTVFVALMQAHSGAEHAQSELVEVVESFGGDRNDVFRKIIVPSSLVWVFAGFRLNVGFALLGAFLGEYMSSRAGLGHFILVAGGLYNIPAVFVGVTLFGVVGLILSGGVSLLGKYLTQRFVSRI
jgi:NitT/TauT family transport system permease protein